MSELTELTHFSKKCFIALTQAFELAAHTIITREGTRCQGIADWEISPLLKARIPESWLISVGHTRDYLADAGYEPTLVRVMYDDDLTTYYYRCPRTYVLHELHPNDTAIYRIHEEHLMMALAQLLELPVASRRYAPVTPNMWALGTLDINNVPFLVFVIRHFDHRAASMMTYLKNIDAPALVLLMVDATPIIPSCLHITFVYIADVLMDVDGRVCLDRPRLEARVNFPHTKRPALHRHSLHFDDVHHVLSIRGLPDWWVKGEKQVNAIRYMVQQTLKGRYEMTAKEILDAARTQGQVSGAKRMQSLFSSSEQWRDYIVSPRRGIYRFREVE